MNSSRTGSSTAFSVPSLESVTSEKLLNFNAYGTEFLFERKLGAHVNSIGIILLKNSFSYSLFLNDENNPYYSYNIYYNFLQYKTYISKNHL